MNRFIFRVCTLLELFTFVNAFVSIYERNQHHPTRLDIETTYPRYKSLQRCTVINGNSSN